MCFNCGCHLPQDNMGSEDNITDDTFKDLADHWKISLEDTKVKVLEMLKNNQAEKDSYLNNIFINATKVWGQSKNEAIKNTRELLDRQMKLKNVEKN